MVNKKLLGFAWLMIVIEVSSLTWILVVKD